MNKLGLTILFIFTFCFKACLQPPVSDFYETDGIISADASSIENNDAWVGTESFGSSAMASQEVHPEVPDTLSFQFYLRNPGSYNFSVLAAIDSPSATADTLYGTIRSEEGMLLERFGFAIQGTGRPHWSTENIFDDRLLRIDLQDPGRYKIVLRSGGDAGILFYKLQAIRNGQPSGIGYPPTSDHQMDPELAKRAEPVTIPPAWSFGLIIGTERNPSDVAELLEENDNQQLLPDAIWFDLDEDFPREVSEGMATESLKSLRESLEELNDTVLPGLGRFQTSGQHSLFRDDNRISIFDDEVEFYVVGEQSTTEHVSKIYEAIESDPQNENKRAFLISDANQILNPDFKKFPINRSAKNLYGPASTGGFSRLEESIKMAAARLEATYEIPFFALDNGRGELPEREEERVELLLRWMQFAAFNSVMHLYESEMMYGEGLSFFENERLKSELERLASVRRSLFPYIYSISHLIRATGQQPVRSTPNRNDQFLLGESLLIAPVYEQGRSERPLYLPEGIWYNYWSGTQYDGGTEWLVDASPTTIPVFVKAGSIIPRRSEAVPILEGNNERLHIDIYGGNRGTFRMYEDDGLSNAYRQGELSTTAFRYFEGDGYSTFTIGEVFNRFEGQPPQKEMTMRFLYTDEPSGVTANGETLPKGEGLGEWSYDANERLLTIRWIQPNDIKTDFRIMY